MKKKWILVALWFVILILPLFVANAGFLFAETVSTSELVPTPKGYFMINPHVYGKVTDKDLKEADKKWEKVCEWVEIDPKSIHHFDFKFWDRNFSALINGKREDNLRGLIEGSTIEVVHDDEETWDHEMLHLAFGIKTGNRDIKHTVHFWKGVCGCPSEK